MGTCQVIKRQSNFSPFLMLGFAIYYSQKRSESYFTNGSRCLHKEFLSKLIISFLENCCSTFIILQNRKKDNILAIFSVIPSFFLMVFVFSCIEAKSVVK